MHRRGAHRIPGGHDGGLALPDTAEVQVLPVRAAAAVLEHAARGPVLRKRGCLAAVRVDFSVAAL